MRGRTFERRAGDVIINGDHERQLCDQIGLSLLKGNRFNR